MWTIKKVYYKSLRHSTKYIKLRVKLWSYFFSIQYPFTERKQYYSLINWIPLWRKKLLLYSTQVLQQWTTESHTRWRNSSLPETHLPQSPAGKWVTINTEYSKHYFIYLSQEISKADELRAYPSVRWNTSLPSQLGEKHPNNVFQNQIQRPKVNLWPLPLFRTRLTMKNR